MTDYKKYLPELIKYGYDTSENISDFWFKNKDQIASILFGGTGKEDQFSLLVRWESEIGRECSKSVKQFIIDKQEAHRIHRNEQSKLGIREFTYVEIDFNTFTFFTQNQEYNLKSFSAMFSTSQIGGISDLRGIDLTGITIRDSTLKNGFFSQSNFSNSNLQQLQFQNINFVKANFHSARLTSISFDTESTLGGANFKNAFLNAITLTDDILGAGIEINEISYVSLIFKAFFNEDYNRKIDHSEFLLVDTKSITSYDLANLKRYIEWYMTISKKIRDSKKNVKKQASVLFQIVISKYWTSFSVFGSITFLTILLLSSLFYCIPSNFKIPSELGLIGFFDSIYFVVVTFTTLGYGDISPLNWLGQLFVIVTVLIGYLFLGIFIFLLSRKIGAN